MYIDKSYLNRLTGIVIDRPLGSKHPRYGYEYPINYGYVPDTLADDGKEIDAYVLDIDLPLSKFSGICIAIIHRRNDVENKLILALPDVSFSDAEIWSAVSSQERYFDSLVVR